MSKKKEADPTLVEETEVAPKKGKKKLILAAAGALVLLGGGGGAYAFMGGDEASARGEHGEAAEAESDAGHGNEEGEAKAGFVEVPTMRVNLHSSDGSARMLNVRFTLVPGPKDTVEGLTAKLPLLLDAYQPFLRELRPEELNGSAAIYRVKEEMLVRADDVLGHDHVKDVLIQDMIEQ